MISLSIRLFPQPHVTALAAEESVQEMRIGGLLRMRRGRGAE